MDHRRHRAAVAAARAAEATRLADALAGADRRDARFALTRLALAGATIALVVGGAMTGRWSPLWGGAGLAAFAVVAARHARATLTTTRLRREAALVDLSLARLDDRWAGRGVTHTTHLPDGHPYAEDLDLFGAGSLFDLLCTARTEAGERTLAAWLLAPAAPAVVARRQAAVTELATRDALRTDLGVLGPDLPGAAATAALARWATAPAPLPPAWGPWALAAMSAATVGGLVAWSATGEEPAWMAGALVAQGIVGLWMRPRVRAAIHAVDDRARDLTLVAELAARLEREPFESDDLRALQARLSATGVPASVHIRRLARLVDLLTSRQNQLFGPLSVLLFWATQLAWAVARWRARAGRAVPDWLAVLGEFEALAALATFAAEHPDAVQPAVTAGVPRLDGRDVVHPLLPAASAVGNDIALGGDGPRLLMVSGSNMSGKSTYMRAIGVNVVLAQAGAPVCAAAFALTPLVPAGTLRVQDSLQAGRSRFFAEITKLRQVVDLARAGGAGTLFLLDELLAGTNSHDRQQGAEGVLRGLLALGAIGIATTHDLAVAALVDHLGAPGASAHFADRFDEGGLAFDYRLRPGVVATSNALALMRSVGLDV